MTDPEEDAGTTSTSGGKTAKARTEQHRPSSTVLGTITVNHDSLGEAEIVNAPKTKELWESRGWSPSN